MNRSEHESLAILRHSAAHLLAHAVLELYPDTLLTIGPATPEGFFYDVLPVGGNFKEEDLAELEARMHEIAERNYPIVGKQVSKDEARKVFAHNKFKLELIDTIPADTVGIYTQGNFSDLCKGGHVETIGELKHFKLTALAGSYWRADRNGEVLQRISGVIFPTAGELEAYLKRIEEAKLYDHRRLGKQLDLFSFHDEAPGMVFFHDKGQKIFTKMIEYSREMQRADYQEIKTPIVLKETLWKQSGHYDHYRDNMYFTTEEEGSYCIRPMNCPASILVYKERPHSYRELPLRLSEYGLCHRRELSGVLHGMFRVRSFTQDDAHIYCTIDQIEQEVLKVLELARVMYARFGFSDIAVFLATRPEKSLGSDEYWERATAALSGALERAGMQYEIKAGDGAFYGPKIELHIRDAMGRQWQCGTVQVDFFMPINFGLDYIDAAQQRHVPVMVHRAIYGSIERFMGILLEHYKGHFPFWLAPVQVRTLVITDNQREYAGTIAASLRLAGIRVEVDDSGDQIGAQIRRAQSDKIPWMLVIGKKEQETGTVSLRLSDGSQESGLTIEQLLDRARKLNAQ